MTECDRRPDRVSLFGIRFDAVRLSQAVDRLRGWIADPSGVCRYVVTPNVDHVVLLRQDARFRNAYDQASMIVADGFPLVLFSRLVGRPLPERVAGSDLVPALLAGAPSAAPLRVFLLGAAPGVAERAAQRIEASWTGVNVTGTYSPPLGFERNDEENRRILDRIAAAEVDLLVIGLGAPKQELWIHRFHRQVKASVAVCAGATIDFLAGEKKRAPRWMQKAGVEWCHRMLSEPRRLVRRYARDAWIFPQLAWQEWVAARK